MGKGNYVSYTIRLYRPHDLDLITFIANYEFDITKAMYSALSAFVQHDVFVIQIPKRKNENSISSLKRVHTRTLYLHAQRDAEMITLLDKIQSGYRNNFLKNLLRQYLCFPISADFLINHQDMESFEDRFKMFRTGKRLAKAGKMTRTVHVEKDKNSSIKSSPKSNSSQSQPEVDMIEKEDIASIEKEPLNDSTVTNVEITEEDTMDSSNSTIDDESTKENDETALSSDFLLSSLIF